MIFTLFQQMILCSQLTDVARKSNQAILIRLFVATVESILLYGSETWTLTESLKKRIDRSYTRMLRMVLNVYWKQHKTNKEVYGNLPRATMKIQVRNAAPKTSSSCKSLTSLGAKSWSEHQRENSHDLPRQHMG